MRPTSKGFGLAAYGLLLAAGLVHAQPPASWGSVKFAPTQFRITTDPAECAKMYGHLTLNEINGWWKKIPSSQAEAEQFLSDMVQATSFYDEAQRCFSAGQPGKGREAMARCFAALFRHFNEDAVPIADVHGAYGVMLARAGDVSGADEAFRKQRVCIEKAFPAGRFPDGHPRLALFLLTTGTGQLELGRHSAAEALFREALRMYRKQGPAHPNGSDFTTLLIQLSAALFARKEYAEAEQFAQEALDRCQELCKTPESRSQYLHLLATAKNNLGEILRVHAEKLRISGNTTEATRLLARADTLLGEAVDLGRGLSARGQLGIKLRNQSALALGSGDYRKALALSEEAMREVETAYPAAEYPNGHPDLVTVLHSRGDALVATGDRVAAGRMYSRCLNMVRVIYPDDRCPDGHPELASILVHLGDLYLRSPAMDDQRSAAQFFRDSLNISLGHTRAQAAYLSEVGMLQQVGAAIGAVDGLLSVATPFDSRDYWYLWETKAAVMRVIDHRRRASIGTNDPAVLALINQLAATRLELANKALAPATDSVNNTAVSDLTRKKEELEVRLAAAQGLPVPSRTGVGPMALAKVLPATAAFIDFWSYARIEQDRADASDAGRRASAQYVAFIMTHNGDLTRVELGPVRVIDSAVDEWLARITATPYDPIAEREAAKKVADLVWQPIRARLEPRVDTVYICPEGAFGRLPFSALPDLTGTKVLLEELNVVEVPHGPGLHAHLSSTRQGPVMGPAVAIGAVDYGAPAPGGLLARWGDLPATAKEVQAIQKIAGEGHIGDVQMLIKGDATPSGVLNALATARVAHFATHGFATGADPNAGIVSARAFTHNRLIGCGLALTGANTAADRGTLLGETIASLRLNQLDLAVLSACNTAIGTTVMREGVYALRRAFHAAGCRAVVASLWAVDDDSTAALMSRFYYHLWVDRLSPDQSLWKAQIDLYKSPAEIPTWAEGRRGDVGPPRIGTVTPLPPAPSVIRESLPRKWAGFRLSISY